MALPADKILVQRAVCEVGEETNSNNLQQRKSMPVKMILLGQEDSGASAFVSCIYACFLLSFHLPGPSV